ncbi:MAG: hypothetical protein AAB385_12235, partial [Planctomycetota bacterium]
MRQDQRLWPWECHEHDTDYGFVAPEGAIENSPEDGVKLMYDSSSLRIIDANFNRAREALRVME